MAGEGVAEVAAAEADAELGPADGGAELDADPAEEHPARAMSSEVEHAIAMGRRDEAALGERLPPAGRADERRSQTFIITRVGIAPRYPGLQGP